MTIDEIGPFLTLTKHEFATNIADKVMKKSRHEAVDKELRLISGWLKWAACVVDNTEWLLSVINNTCCLLKPPTDEPQLLVNCLMPALLHDLVGNVGGKLMLSEGQEWANFINCCLYFVVLIPAQ